MAIKHMKRGLTLLAIKAMQIKTSMRYLTPMRATIIKMTDINIGSRCGETRSLIH